MSIYRLSMYAISAVFAAMAATAAFADWPERPIELVIAFPPGSHADVSGRLFQTAMSKALDGATIVPLNVPGAGGTIGTAQAAAAAPDGYTVAYSPVATVTIQPHLRPLPYGKDSFIPICKISDTATAILVAPDSKYNSLDDLMKDAKAGGMVATGQAVGSLPHIVQAAAAKAYGVGFVYLPTDGGAASAKAILGGEAVVQGDIYTAANIYGTKALAVASAERLAALPDVPTLRELGHDIQLSVWFGAFVPAGTPDAIVEKLSTACAAALRDADFVKGMETLNYQISYLGREDFAKFFSDQYKRNASLLAEIGLVK
ncbi:hypothetical protein MesoLjLc_30970 [Mesorhizobium sp. L-8-10]|uniref:tripartite tricarboxylate transporter substrate binding protein n=1 Tax=unclassified Mesorhizobium TaxID=325217 RepID=UPI0019270620|nr:MULTISPECIES: tripartite tricarboxylate transporter substrate binding protein [unclassified Mesorhizobium]BCH23396.1 hypothetical protein MesoLjLb_31810 [Mesorhizobium sp. L-8-3]BCH31167.1 hypothetical protein MesoLjLc_30970 [Mesorhizobium sp. L-8-10]